MELNHGPMAGVTRLCWPGNFPGRIRNPVVRGPVARQAQVEML